MKKTRNKGKNNSFFVISAAVAVIAIVIAVYAVKRYAPSKERVSLNDYFARQDGSIAVIHNGSIDNTIPCAKIIDGELYFSLEYLKKYVDDGYVYDSVEKNLRYTTDKNVIAVNANNKNYMVDKDSVSYEKVILRDVDGKGYLNADWSKKYSDYVYTLFNNPNRVVVETAGWKKTVATLSRNTELRTHGGIKSKIISDGKKNDSVVVVDDYGKWSKVVSSDGVLGCVQNKYLTNETSKVVKKNLEDRKFKHRKVDGKIVLAWNQISNKSANATAMKSLDKLENVNVVSPTWFYIKDADGNVGNDASLDYVSYAHSKGMQVWAAIDNFRDKSVDTAHVLKTTSARDNLINQTIAAAIASNIDGINVDFESISDSEKDGYLEFIRELSLKCEKNNLILSVDNYVPTAATKFYGRKTQADYADYVVIMAYDEHFGGSKEAGSVSSFPFVRNGVKDTLKEVPKNQIVLGLPLYTRVWCTENGNVTSSAVGMNNQYKKIGADPSEAKWLETEQQNYVEKKDGDKLYQCWIEDNKSLGKKMELVNSNGLAGAAFWKMGLGSDDIWTTISKYIRTK